ncbi:MAG: SDR family NAD(P)-dependent oxidoreductase [Proteobacteria bacterium]|nr:SDR family NAD(P)-dependent oxidoreductase [Pseudomonadota bacterium]MBI3497680.1 SDR family NAD(P)-dependent oxidoreductase [Pseudomonadota bacterium]
MRPPSSILITGASSGIGAALARDYAGPGMRLVLGGRDEHRLAAVADSCRKAGALVSSAIVDVTDPVLTANWVNAADSEQALDLLIANAGISAGTGGAGETQEQARRIYEVNVLGALNTVYPVLPAMRARRRGQIALIASLAGYRGFPGAPAYCGSKAALKVHGEALRGELAADGIGVSVVCPGYVATAMTARNRFPMPFLMPPERAARIIRYGLARNRARIAFPWPMAAAAWLLQALPPGWTDPMLRLAPRKQAD